MTWLITSLYACNMNHIETLEALEGCLGLPGSSQNSLQDKVLNFYVNEGVKLFSNQGLCTHTLPLFCKRGNIEQLSNGLLYAYKLTDKSPRYKHEIYMFYGFFFI